MYRNRYSRFSRRHDATEYRYRVCWTHSARSAYENLLVTIKIHEHQSLFQVLPCDAYVARMNRFIGNEYQFKLQKKNEKNSKVRT